MRHGQVCHFGLATALLLIAVQVAPAWADQYRLPSKGRYPPSGYVPPQDGNYPPDNRPKDSGYYPSGEQNFDCKDTAHLENYKNTLDNWITNYEGKQKAAEGKRDAAKKDEEKAAEDFSAAAAAKPPDRGAEEKAKKRYDDASAAYANYANQIEYYKKAIKYLQEELKRTVRDYHDSCHCTYFCDRDYWMCPGSPPPPPKPPYNPQTVGGQCR